MDGLRKKLQQEWQSLERQLREWGVDLETFRARASRASADLKVDYEKQIAALRAKLREARGRLEEIKKAGGAATEEMEKGLEAAWSDLTKAFDEAMAQFKKQERPPESKSGSSSE